MGKQIQANQIERNFASTIIHFHAEFLNYASRQADEP
mgnify:CR=1 FL=1|jgi:hypothetical protein